MNATSGRTLLPRWAACLLAGACLLAAAFLLACQVAPRPAGAQGPAALQRLLAEESLRKPVHLAEVPDGSGDLVVVEQAGLIRRFAPDASRASGTFLDLRARVSTAGNEEGLLSIAFHPAYRSNRTFFVYHSAADPRRSVVARFRAGDGGGAAQPPGGEPVLEVSQPYSNHNGGQLAFGPDGMLYIALGDGGAGGDPHGNGQNRRTLLGAILRIDVERRDPGLAYAVPPDNPFAGARDGSRGEIWAYGLRNPWRFSFDRATGELFAADVGQDEIEEVDRIVKGGNYGWNAMEGSRCFRPSRDCDRRGLELPLAEYTHRDGRSITGGFVYRGRAIPALAGHYLFADYAAGTLWSIPAGTRAPTSPRRLLDTGLAVSSFGEDAAGEVYLLDHGQGRVYRLVPAR